MSRLGALFLPAASGPPPKRLIAYFCVGYPSVDESLALVRAAVDAGADAIELGVPFSDPSADGPTIADASRQALEAGSSLEASLGVARALRESHSDVPIVLFGYLNPFFVHGERKLIDDAKAAGVDALLVVDLPLSEPSELRDRAHEVGLSMVPLLAPTSTAAHIEAIRGAHAHADVGFVYVVSATGVTGVAEAPIMRAASLAADARAKTRAPTCIGFGIDSGEKARAAVRGADGVIVGSALVRAIASGRAPESRVEAVSALVGELRAALDATAKSD